MSDDSVKSPFTGLGSALRLLRQRHGLTQQQIADKAGITKAMMSAYEVGKYFPAVETLSRLLRSLECDLRGLQDAMEEATAGSGAAGQGSAQARRAVGIKPGASAPGKSTHPQ